MSDMILFFSIIGIVAASIMLYGILMGRREDRERDAEETRSIPLRRTGTY